MPITTSTTKVIINEKKISKIIIDDDNMFIQIEIVYREKYEDGHIISERRTSQNINGPEMLNLSGIEPRLEVPSGMNYYEAVKDRCYSYLTEKELW